MIGEKTSPSMKIGYETIVSYWPEAVLKRSDFAYLDKVIPEEERELLEVPDEVRRVKDKDGAEILGESGWSVYIKTTPQFIKCRQEMAKNYVRADKAKNITHQCYRRHLTTDVNLRASSCAVG